jgi:hypothetical protein
MNKSVYENESICYTSHANLFFYWTKIVHCQHCQKKIWSKPIWEELIGVEDPSICVMCAWQAPKNMEHGFPCSAHTIKNKYFVHKPHSIYFSCGYFLGPLQGE